MLRKTSIAKVIQGLMLTTLATFISFSAYADKADKGHHKKHHSSGLSVMVLGSGGPVVTKKRAGASYVVFADGKPRILMDAGGGAIARLGKAGINIKDLDIVLLSHLHLDHTSDLSAIIKMMFFQNRAAGQQRDTPIRIFGAGANSTPAFSNTTDYIDGHYHKQLGLERYLHGFAPAINAGTFSYEANDVSSDLVDDMTTIVSDDDGLVVKAIAINHGPVPALAFRIEYKGKSIVYSGDTTSRTDNMIQLSQDADLLIYDTAILDDAPAPFINLHTTPARIGVVANAANVKRLLLSHITPMTENSLHDIKHIVRDQGYTGRLKVAKDLKYIRLSKKH